ncbi:MAG: hypothetical protein HY899_08135 [Deltaproteobacteria bacterium]|nr:hypothetical protein [Deltaproteobacteria bacterium]
MDWLLRYTDPSIDWSYATVTLIVRFIGVFVVMAVVQAALQIASAVIIRLESRGAAPATAPAHALVSLDLSAMAEHEAELDGSAMAAIGLALTLEAQQQVASSRIAGAEATAHGPSAWALAGRMRGLR